MAAKRITKPHVRLSGKAVVERCQECDACQEWLLTPFAAPDCGHLLVMLPSGEVIHAAGPVAAANRVREWFQRDGDDDAINIGTIEWRHGITPPKSAPIYRTRTKIPGAR